MVDLGKVAPPPLAGLVVLDFTRVIAGPYLTMMLADLGADVIKIEAPPGGDDSRAYQPPGRGGEAAVFLGLNRTKRSMLLDLSTSSGQDVVRRLATHADVLVENFRPGSMDRLGLGWQALRRVNAGLVYCAISGYGYGNRFSELGGYDPIAQAETGLMYLTGHPGAKPVRAGGSVVDLLAGLHAGMAILAALRARAAGGEGQFIDVALFDTALSAIGFILQGPLLTGKNPPRTGNVSFFMCPNGVYSCSDGDVMMSAGNDRLFGKMCAALELPELLADPRFASNALRLTNVDALTEALERRFGEHARAHWVARLRAAGVPCGAVRTPLEALASEEAAARDMVREIAHSRAGQILNVGSPLRLHGTPVRPPSPSPILGEHTEQVLRELLGCTDAELTALRATGAIPAA
jgi:crotonobetainyl-CoA:carnitine CoA-transferase CaiB-like acyl-CoA transferase